MLDQIEVLQAAAEAKAALREARGEVRERDQEAWSPRIMLADDDTGFRRMLREWLSDLGVKHFVEAADGVEAVHLAETTCPDLILMDLRMPNMDGIEAARRVRATLPSAQVVMLSGYGDEWLQHAAEEAGVYSYLVKSCSPEVLWHTIRFARTHKLHNGERAAAG